jgi:hypothetical protein
MYRTNADIARRVYRALKTPSDDNPRTDPILAFHFEGKDDYIMMRCNKTPEVSIKGKHQTAGEVKFFSSPTAISRISPRTRSSSSSRTRSP